jgi:class 3 adenylate cyclase
MEAVRLPWWIPESPPADLAPADHRAWSVMVRIYPVATAFHLAYLPIFWWLGSPLMAWFNVGSVICWVVASRLVRNGWLVTGANMALVELLAHAAVATHIFGLVAGFHYYTLTTPLAAYILDGRTRTKLLSVALTTLTLGAILTAEHLVPATPPVSDEVGAILGALNVVGVGFVIGAFAHWYSNVAHQLEQEVRREHARSEELLHNILPVPIAERLKRAEETIADHFEETTILFSDIVGFTELSANVTAEELVGLLNRIFSELDVLADRYGLEKIKTIGDAYMVAAGLPEPREDHAEAVAGFALDMVDALDRLCGELGVALTMRIGIHTGPVVAGVIGKRKFSYDMWGDSVNTASRMESHGEPGRIHVSRATYEKLRDRFELSDRGEVEVKGKGRMHTWFLEGRAPG